jgi:hypothetical protein
MEASFHELETLGIIKWKLLWPGNNFVHFQVNLKQEIIIILIQLSIQLLGEGVSEWAFRYKS